MPRAMWSGAISFGLVNIPIKLYNAVSRKTVHFNQIDTKTGARIQYKKVSAADGREVPGEEITRGYQLASGDHVLVGDDATSERWRSEFLYSRAATIYGGSAEIQRNIVARRLLDLGAES